MDDDTTLHEKSIPESPEIEIDPFPTMDPIKEQSTPGVEIKQKDPHFPYALIILAGVMALINGILLLSMDFQHIQEVQFEGGSVANAITILDWVAPIEMILGVSIIIMGILSWKTTPKLGPISAVVAIISFGPLLLSSILGIISLILLRRYKKMANHHG